MQDSQPSYGTVRTFFGRRRRAAGFVAGVAVTALVAGGGVAVAAIPSSSRAAFTGCVSKATGALRVIDRQAGKHCVRKRERVISWSRGWSYAGAFSATTPYGPGAVVVDAGSSYVARASSTARPPAANPVLWGLLAGAGTQGATGATGPRGAAGAAGATGASGAMGPAGPVSLRYVTASVSVPARGVASGLAQCPVGTSVTGGGVQLMGSNLALEGSFPYDGGDSDVVPDDAWDGVASNASTTSAETFLLSAICTSATSTQLN